VIPVKKYRLAVTIWIGFAFAVALCLGVGGLADGMDKPARGEGVESTPFTELLLQSSEPVTTYLPLVSKEHPPPPPVFGVQMHTITEAGGLQQAVDAGVHWVRYSAFHWDRIEPSRTNPPTYDWDQVDETSLQNAYQDGLQVVAIVQFTPSWAQKYAGSYCGPIQQDRFDEFAQFLGELVQRYKDPPYGIKYWEIGNEPDAPWAVSHSVFGCWGEPLDPYYGGRYYGEMLKHAYPAIKAADPQAQVLIGGLLLDCDPDDPPPGAACTMSRFLEGILEAGGGSYFDIISFHAYAYYGASEGRMANGNWTGGNWEIQSTAIPEKVAFLRKELQRYGVEDKVVMNTEAALLCSEATASCFETQAMYVPRAYAEALALGLKGQIYYAMINESWRHTGLIYSDLTPKPVFGAYQTAASFLADAQHVGIVSGYPGGVAGYAFQQREQGGHVDVIWTTDGSGLSLTLPAGSSAYDRYGNLVSSSGTFWLDRSPVYVMRPDAAR